jgi:hypothetical protein
LEPVAIIMAPAQHHQPTQNNAKRKCPGMGRFKATEQATIAIINIDCPSWIESIDTLLQFTHCD